MRLDEPLRPRAAKRNPASRLSQQGDFYERRSSSGSLAKFTAQRLVLRQPGWSLSGATPTVCPQSGEKRKCVACARSDVDDPKRHFAAVNCCIAKAPHDEPAPVFKSVQNCSDSVLRRTHPESRAPLGEQEANIDQFIACLNIARYVDLLKAETDRTKRGLLQKLSVEDKDQTGPVALYGHG